MTETKSCQNCKKDFVIEQADFDFYKKIDVPAPTFCPECRAARRYAWRNERSLTKSVCGLCQKTSLSMYTDKVPFPVYCRECWLSDKWDPMSFGVEYDFTKPFFEQYRELRDRTPHVSLFQVNAVDAPYANVVRGVKRAYLGFSVVQSEDVYYTQNIDRCHHIFDCTNMMDSDQAYWNIYGTKNYNTHFSVFTRNCLDSMFLYDCVNAQHCFMSANVRNKEYVLRNQQYTKEEYERELAKIDTGSHEVMRSLRDEFRQMRERAISKFASLTQTVNSSGDVLINTKNVRYCFDVYNAEDVAYSGRCFGLKDSYDIENTGLGSELVYEYVSGGENNRMMRFSANSYDSLSDVEYTISCGQSSNLFGCFGLRNKQYCILNKQYSKEEYEALVPKIKKHMDEMPYVDKAGRVYRYGEFFPVELSPFGYNETVAQQYFPLTKGEAAGLMFFWRDAEEKKPVIDILGAELPDRVQDVGDEILQKTIGCEHAGSCDHQCTVGFRLVPAELELYRRTRVPLPRLCPNCRHFERMKERNPWRLWHGRCKCEQGHGHHKDGRCPNEFETSYAPERREMVYCESCYNAEVV